MHSKYKVVTIIALATILGIGIFIAQNKQDKETTQNEQEITLPITARGDLVDPGPIEEECQNKLEKYTESTEFEGNGFTDCLLKESRVGKSDEECPNGFSSQGCSICRLTCQ